MQGVHDIVKGSSSADDEAADEQGEERERREPVNGPLRNGEPLNAIGHMSSMTVASGAPRGFGARWGIALRLPGSTQPTVEKARVTRASYV